MMRSERPEPIGLRIFASVKRRSRALSLAMTIGTLAATAGAAPAAASASTRTPTIVLGGLTDHGYGVAVVLQQDGSKTATVEVDFQRREGRQYQVYSYDYSGDVAFEISGGLRTAMVKAGFNEAGAIALSLRFATKVGRIRLPDQYSFFGPLVSSVRARTGVATGMLKFNSHSPFGTIERRSLRAYLTYASPAQPITARSKFTMLMSYGSSKVEGNTLIAMHAPKLTMVATTISKNPTNAYPFEMDAIIDQTGPAGIFDNVGLASAQISVHGPFLTGQASYSSTLTCNKDTTYGSLTGSVVAHFVIGGRQVYPGQQNLKNLPGLPAGLPNPFGMMMSNGADLFSGCAGSDTTGGSTSSAPTLSLP